MTSTWLTAGQVAQRLGVKPATVYAYVSRGLLHRQIGDDGRTSRFDPAEVDELARRGRPRRDVRRTGIVDVVLSTTLTEISDGALRYRATTPSVWWRRARSKTSPSCSGPDS